MPVLWVSTELEPAAAGSSAPSCCLRACISDTLCDRTLMPQPLTTQLTHYSGHIKAFTVKTFTSCGIKAVALGVCRGGGIPAGISLAGLEKSVSSLLSRNFAAGLGVRLLAQAAERFGCGAGCPVGPAVADGPCPCAFEVLGEG